jgi:hypothetical protein
MLNLFKLASLVAVSALPAVAAGCASANAGRSAPVSAGMMCPKCETVWVSQVVGQGTKVQRMVSEREMTCPECDAMAVSQLTGDGKVILHDCPTCKVTPLLVTPKPAIAPSHLQGTH